MTRLRDYNPLHFVPPIKAVDRMFLAFVGMVFAILWINSAKLLVASRWREDGRVLACVYFTGFNVQEHQLDSTPANGDLACPVFKLG